MDLQSDEKLYYLIGEVSQICSVESQVLRYWEKIFTQIKPKKVRKRRYYSKTDIDKVKYIRYLLYDLGYTVKGAKKQLALQSNKNAKVSERSLEELEKSNPTSINSNLSQLRNNDLSLYQPLVSDIWLIKSKISLFRKDIKKLY